MKHTFKVTVVLVLFFFMAQFAGLLIINYYIDHKRTAETKSIEWKPLPYSLERPQVQNQSASFIYIVAAILVGTILVLLLIRFRKISLFKIWMYTGILRIIVYAALFFSSGYPILIFSIAFDLIAGYLIWKFNFTIQDIWKVWFFATVWLTLSISFAAFLNSYLAVALALGVAALKLYKPNVLIQNLSEIFIYGGLAAIFVPMINVFAAFMLLTVISIYDFIAVFKTKHMVALAKFQSQSKIFAGLAIPYERNKISIKTKVFEKLKSRKKEASISGKHGASGKSLAVLGGGDIGFTLIFAGVVMKVLMLQETILVGFLKALIIPFFCSIALLFLLLKGQQNKFYPAMPALSLGCFIGYLVVLLV